MRGTGARILLAAALLGLFAFGVVAPGSASDGTTMSILASPNSGPALRAVSVEARGHAPVQIDVYGTYKSLGAGARCATTPGGDGGTDLIATTGLGGSYQAHPYYQPLFPAGNYLLCAWAEPSGADESTPPLASSSSIVHSVLPHVSVSLTAVHRIPFDGFSRTAVRWAANGPIELWLDSRRAGAGPCAPRRSEEPRGAVDYLSGGTHDFPTDYATVGPGRSPGTNSLGGVLQTRVGARHPGRYRLCAYAQEPVAAGGTDRPSATVPVARVMTATFIEAPPLAFHGRTSQGKSVRFVDANGTLTKLTFGIVYVCNDPRHTRFPSTLSAGSAPAAVHRGAFRVLVGGTSISGHIHGKRAVGTAGPLSYKTNGYVCAMPRVRWSARAK
jgi:hypothetical protein